MNTSQRFNMTKLITFAMLGLIAIASFAYAQGRLSPSPGSQEQASEESSKAVDGKSKLPGRLTAKQLDAVKLEKIKKSDDQWKKELTPLQFDVTRKAGTERAFTGTYWNNKKSGTYYCRCCDLPLFTSETKFRSGSGWPSFYQPLREEFITNKRDTTHGMIRTETVCSRCSAHLGHVFTDGPRPTGLRYCMNSAALKFVADNQNGPGDSGKKAKATQGSGGKRTPPKSKSGSTTMKQGSDKKKG